MRLKKNTYVSRDRHFIVSWLSRIVEEKVLFPANIVWTTYYLHIVRNVELWRLLRLCWTDSHSKPWPWPCHRPTVLEGPHELCGHIGIPYCQIGQVRRPIVITIERAPTIPSKACEIIRTCSDLRRQRIICFAFFAQKWDLSNLLQTDVQLLSMFWCIAMLLTAYDTATNSYRSTQVTTDVQKGCWGCLITQ